MKSTTKEFATNDQANYYSGITSIKVNGKNAYELKGKFLDDLHKNAFSGTNGEDVIEHIEYFPKIVDPIDLPNVNYDKLRVVVFPISLVGDAWRWFDEIKGSIDSWVALTAKFFRKYYPPSRTGRKLGSDEIEPTNEEFSNLKETDHNDEPSVKSLKLEQTCSIMKHRYVPWVHEKPWTNDEAWKEPTPVKHCSKPFNYKTGCSEWPTCSWRDDGYCNGGNLLGAYIVGNSLHYQDYEWYEALEDSELKDIALRNKAIMEELIEEGDESSNKGWRRWNVYEDIDHDHEYEMKHEDEEGCGAFDQEQPVCNIRRFKMIKYSFGHDKEYVAIKEDEYEDLTNTSEDACAHTKKSFA
ncbi:hypothetical protein Tco_1383997 [Tanacetum coccineum]